MDSERGVIHSIRDGNDHNVVFTSSLREGVWQGGSRDPQILIQKLHRFGIIGLKLFFLTANNLSLKVELIENRIFTRFPINSTFSDIISLS